MSRLYATDANYAGRCPLCGDEIDEGDPIVRFEDGWVHAECAEDKGEEVVW